MRYASTRGQAPILEYDDVLLAGLASDGGLYLPERWPQFSPADIRQMQGLNYSDLAVRVMAPFIGGRINTSEFETIVKTAYKNFSHDAVAPLKQLEPTFWLMELFHGPTLAFKDYPMQLIGRLFAHVLSKRGERVTIVGATSGDTGSAAIEAFQNQDAVDIFILYPHGRVSDVQRRQMTTVIASNVHCIAIEGTFDDCQDLVKGMFSDASFRESVRLSAVNSINWARVAAQVVYYFYAAVLLGAPDRCVSFAVPTGNFGNIFAAYTAKACGLPIDQLIIGTNKNDILTRFFQTGHLSIAQVSETISPSMDIQISSNFERFLFDIYGRDSGSLVDAMASFRRDGKFSISGDLFLAAQKSMCAMRLNDLETMAEMKRLLDTTGELVDPHTAIGVAAGRARRCGNTPVIAQASAHPSKFPEAVRKATGVTPVLPAHLSDLYDREEHFQVLPNDLGAIVSYVREGISREGVV